MKDRRNQQIKPWLKQIVKHLAQTRPRERRKNEMDNSGSNIGPADDSVPAGAGRDVWRHCAVLSHSDSCWHSSVCCYQDD